MISTTDRQLEAFEKKRNQQKKYWRDATRAMQDIGPPPKVKNRRRRNRCRDSLRDFLLTYTGEAFEAKFGKDHEALIEMTQTVILEGGNFCVAMPRGSGKTTIFQRAIVWAALYGHSRFPVLVTAEDSAYKRLFGGICKLLQTNSLLLDDFPEVVHPIRSLGTSGGLRARFQLCEGETTYLRWSADNLQFPTTRYTIKANNAGITIGGGGLTSSQLRGQVTTLPDGTNLRPDCALIDDPQSRASAKSDAQCQEREDVIKSDIAKMSGPGKKMSVMVACTVIYRDDVAERLMNQKRSPQWQSLRVKKLQRFPDRMDLWEQYYELRRAENWGDESRGTAAKFYLDKQAELDAGAEVYWPDRIEHGFQSAIESTMVEYFDDPRSFLAEAQNEPEEDLKGDLKELSIIDLVQRQSGFKRGIVPPSCEYLTAFVDVQHRMLYWMVCGITKDFGVFIVDFGTTPKQRASQFIYAQAKNTLQRKYVGDDDSGAIRHGLIDTLKDLSGRQWLVHGGGELQLSRGLVDAGYRPDDVETSLRQSQLAGWMPALGRGIRAKDEPLKLRDKRRGINGYHWIIQKPMERYLRHVFVDVNFWKTEAHQGLLIPSTHSQAILLPKEISTKLELPASHFCAEVAIKNEAKGKAVDEWELKSKSLDNHLWDCLVGCMVAGSTLGVRKRAVKNVDNVRRKPKYEFQVQSGWA